MQSSLSFLILSGIIFGLSGTAISQETEFNPLGREVPIEEMEKLLRIQVEWIELDSAEMTRLLQEKDLSHPPLRQSSNAGPLRKSLQLLIEKGEATLVETAIVTACSGQRAKVESIQEFIYPTEYDPPQILNPEEGKGSKTLLILPQATAFETRNLGVTLEVDPILGADNRTIDLNLAPEITYLTGTESWGKHTSEGGEVEVKMPNIFTVKTTTQVTMIAGEYAFVSAMTPRDLTSGMTNPKRKIMLFLKTDLVCVGLPLEK
ncbi:MAG: hypothetical protein KA250_16630 [Verrucomicrobiales bacterium]|jgi:hypothetical protein|nr:hypothetical protein [Verrucomicrobiales bacterium]MBP9225850.1 hypothetical protein [Verrucomicrobiales bacterium]